MAKVIAAFLLLLLCNYTMSMSQVALVKGANRGIGKEVCRQLALKGYQVLLGSRSLENGQQAVSDLGLDEKIQPIQLDVTDQASVDAAVSKIKESFGVLDVLINNAGINYDDWQRTSAADLDNVKETMETNLYGPWRCSMAFLSLLEASENPRIVNVSSGAGAMQGGMSGSTPAYGVSKAALNALTLKLAADLPSIRVNAVCPGWIATDMGGSGGGPIERGGESVVFAATLPKSGPTGGFFRNGEPISG